MTHSQTVTRAKLVDRLRKAYNGLKNLILIPTHLTNVSTAQVHLHLKKIF